MYQDFFGLHEKPFSIAPDPRYLYMTDQHREALAHLLYGVGDEGGFTLLTGEVGTGKTTICRSLLNQLPDNVNVAFIVNPRVSVVELLETICDELEIDYPQAAGQASAKVLVDHINHYLLEAYARGQNTILIIDEAQNLADEVLEQLRLLTNLETDEKKLLQLILLGQPELIEKLEQEHLRQLAQRITARFHLRPLTIKEMIAYIEHRLHVAGFRGELFSSAALKHIYQKSGGVPRLVNIICDRSMLGAYTGDMLQIEYPMALAASNEVLGESGHGATKAGSGQGMAHGKLLKYSLYLLAAVVLFYLLGNTGLLEELRGLFGDNQSVDIALTEHGVDIARLAG